MRPLLQDFAALAWKPITQAVVLVLALMAFSASAEESGELSPGQHVTLLHLEEDQYEAGKTLRSEIWRSIFGRFSLVHLKLSSAHQTGPYEVEISLSEIDFESTDGYWETDWAFGLIEWTDQISPAYPHSIPASRTIKGSKDHPEMVYREIFNENPKDYMVLIGALNPDFPLSLGGLTYTLDIKLRRVNHCAMWAKIWGDVDYVTYGDVSYFNTFAQPTTVATGSMFDPEMIEMMGDMAQGMAELGFGSAADGDDEETRRSGSEVRKDWEDFVRQESEGGTENWGLSMVDAKMDSDLGALGTLLGGMTIEAAGPDSIHTSEYGRNVFLTLSRLDVVPGKIDPNTGDRIKFTWREGQPGNALLVLGSISEHFMSGIITGDLYSEKEYDGRKLHITVEARFAALRGATSCH